MNSFMYPFAEAVLNLIGYVPSTATPLIVLTLIVIRQLKVASFDLPNVCAFFALLPAFTPLFTQLFGYHYFTMLNYDLQEDPVLKVAAVLLISLFSASFLVGAWLCKPKQGRLPSTRITFGATPSAMALAVAYALVVFLLETGTVLYQTYGSIKQSGTPIISSFANQVFNIIAAFMLANTMGNQRRKVLAIFYVITIITLLLLSRRTLAMSLMILSVYTFALKKISFKQVLMLSLGASLLYFIGEARKVGIVNYLQGVELVGANTSFYALPGGASNVFVGTMGVIHMHANNLLLASETMPALQWLNDVYESEIYLRKSYDYNGGMHIANVLYWNVGTVGMLLIAAVLGWLSARAHFIMQRLRGIYQGTLPAIISVAFIIRAPNFFWYHPIGTINLVIAVSIIFFLLTLANDRPSTFSTKNQRHHLYARR